MYAPGTEAPRRVVTMPVRVPVVAPVNSSGPPDERTLVRPFPAPSGTVVPVVAPVMPAPMPTAIAASRAAPQAVPTPNAPQTIAPIAYAQGQYKETGNPFTAAAQGWVNAQAYAEQQAKEKAKSEEAATLLKDHPDLQKQVQDQVLDLNSALGVAQQRDTVAKAAARRDQIISYLQQSGDTDIAQQFANGILDEDGVAKAVQAKDGIGGSPTADQKDLAQINAERQAAGQEPMTMVQYKAAQKNGFGTDGMAVPDLPMVSLDEKGLPAKDQQQAFLDALDPQTQAIVKGVANYEMDITKVTTLKGDQRQRLAQLVKQYDPTFDMTQYAARAAMRKSITSGNYATALNSANTLIGHMDTLKAAAAELHNQGGLLTPWNQVANAYKNATGDPAITKFNEAKQAVASELAKVFKGTGVPAEKEIEEWKSSFDAAQSPEQIKAAIDQGIELLKSRIDTVQTQYKSTMGHPADFSFLTPHARQVLVDLGYDPSYLDPVSAAGPDFQGADRPSPDQPPASEAAPSADQSGAPAATPDEFAGAPTVQSQADYDKLPIGTPYFEMGDDGQLHKFHRR